jgi:phospholipid-binding lipoprotein MlaA
MSRRALLVAFAPFLFLGGCATAPSDPAALAAFKANNDPWEPFNRKVFAFNQVFDQILMKPIAKGYVRVVPRPGRDALRNVVANLHEPIVFGNNVLQGQFRRAETTLGRFIIDSTLGLGGLFDVAKQNGLKRQTGDVGQTLYVWGVRDGPYLVLPLFGPSNPRDAIGMGLQAYLDPYRWVTDNNKVSSAVAYAPAIIDGVDERSRNIDSLDAIQKSAIDYYASLRSLFRQNRAALLRGDDSSAVPQEEGFYDDPGSAAPQKDEQDKDKLNR